MESKNKLTMLIVDDVELNRAILGELFRDTFNILEASNGVEAVYTLRKYGETITIVLLDIIMPLMDGFGVLQSMKTLGFSGRIPVVMITSEASECVMQRGYEMGVADIISKPFSPNIIRQRIHNIVEQYTYKLHLEQLVAQQTDALRNQSIKLRESSTQMIDILSAVIEFKNTESVGHIHNIRTLTKLLLTELMTQHNEYGLSHELVDIVSEAAAMHDIGKIAIPDHILNKPGKLTDEEFEIMKTHSIRGCEILEKLSSAHLLDYYDYCYEICRHHHERWDGRGYPDGLIGNQTPIWAQVVSLADVYDALTSQRVYKQAYSAEKSINMILAGECGTFNPILLECFLSISTTLLNDATNPANEHPITEMTINYPEKKQLYSSKNISTRTLHLLELERQKYRIMSELSEELLFDYDFKTDKLIFSERFQELTGKNPIVEHLQEHLCNTTIISSKDRMSLIEASDKITNDNPTCKLELQLNLDGNGFIWHEVYLYPVWDTDSYGKRVGYMGKLINIDEHKQKNLQLQVVADSDPLTGILNRSAMHKKFDFLFEEKKISYAALCFIDIDDFKSINDTFGHVFGDNVLQRVAAILSSCARKTDLVARIGGDEFAIFFQGLSDRGDLERKLDVICQKLADGFDDFKLSGSVGAACFPHDGMDFDMLLYKADQALYQSKNFGKNQYRIYSEGCSQLAFSSLQSPTEH